MQILFENLVRPEKPKVSIILIDWSCRESFHTIDYLNQQSIPRRDYEIIWVEYYSRIGFGISERIEQAKNDNSYTPLDLWLTIDAPLSMHYHKHIIYNFGLAFARGKIVIICDSDAIVSPNFLSSIVTCFEKDPNIILHLDEVRNVDHRFYPFNYPEIPDILRDGCINWRDGKTTGMHDQDDILHTRNYGACMCALRMDMIAIGGADEHIDFLGRMCGPYDMTFRLINLGKQEIWHEEEFLYHVWHPGVTEDEYQDYMGPNDGRNMSTTALSVLTNNRILPLVENQAVKELRVNSSPEVSIQKLFCNSYIQEFDKEYLRDRIITIKSPIMVESGYYGFNLILCTNQVFGLAQEEGGFDFERWEQRNYSRCVVGSTIAEVKQLIQEYLLIELTQTKLHLQADLIQIKSELERVQAKLEGGYPNPILIESFGKYNIVAWMGKYYGISQELGAIDIAENPMLEDILIPKGVLIDISLERLRNLISEIERSRSQIQEMESSKFWKLRLAFLQLKQAISLRKD